MLLHAKTFRGLLLSIVVVCLSFYGIGLVFNGYSRRLLSEQWMNSLDTRARFYATQLDNEISSLTMAQVGMFNDNDLLNLHVRMSLMSEYQRLVAVQAVSDRLLSIKLLHHITNNISIYLPDTKRVIRATAPIFDYYDQDAFYGFQRVAWQDGGVYLTSFFPIRDYETTSSLPAFYIRAEITPSTLQAALRSLANDDDGLVLLMNKQGEILGSTGAQDSADTAQDFPVSALVQQRLRTGAESSFRIQENGFASSIAIDDLGLWLVYCQTPDMVARPLALFTALNLALTALVLLLLVSYAVYVWRAFAQPLNRIFTAMATTQETSNLIQDTADNELTQIYNQYNAMVLRMEALIHENYEAKYRAHMAELRQLQYQIRPHFLYNSIFMIYRMARINGDEEMAEYASNLGSYYQYITRISDSEVLISQEIGHVMHYLRIQQMRFGKRITVEVEPIPEDVRDQRIPPLLLQPLVENAYEHGLKSVLSDGQLHIGMVYEQGIFRFTVKDNGVGMTPEALDKLRDDITSHELSAEAHGLTTTHHRLRLHYGAESGLLLDSVAGEGFQVTAVIDFRAKGAEHVQPADR